MKVFISWSGPVSKEVATCLRDFLPLALMRMKFWMSAKDISPGLQWSHEIRRNLSESTVGIVCLTPENLHSSWIYYESGALSHAVGTNLVIPYLYNITASDLEGPLALFQAVPSDEAGTRKLFHSINDAAGGDRLSEQEVESSFSAWWPQIKNRLEEISWDKGEKPRSEREMLEELLEIARQNVNQSESEIRQLSINVIHQVSLTLVNIGLLSAQLKQLLSADKNDINDISADIDRLKGLLAKVEEVLNTQSQVHTLAGRGLYTVRNFISHLSETKYLEAVKAVKVGVGNILKEVVDLALPLAEQKGISIDVSGIDNLPEVTGIEMEIKRSFYNVLDNAIKYSYHTTPDNHSVVRIFSRVPYNPLSRNPRFSIAFENYGLGIANEEMRHVFEPGFRGKQAMAEVPVGSGIGLSEALKIMKVHKGEIKVQSLELNDNEQPRRYMTRVELVFPYSGAIA